MTSNVLSNLQSGNIQQALTDVQSAIKDDPSGSALRVKLFELLCVTGDWSRALTQLNVAADLDAENLLMAQAYREILQCEGYRAAVFEGRRAPLVFGDPPDWIGTLIQCNSAFIEGNITHARKLIDEAVASATPVSGEINGERFEWLMDYDMRIGPVVEAVVNGKYYWIPLANIAEIELSAPEDLRDLVWMPAQFTWTNEGKAIGFIPSRYPASSLSGSSLLEEPDLALAKKTEWIDAGEDYFTGAGQRMLVSDAGEYSLLDVRSIVFDQVVPASN